MKSIRLVLASLRRADESFNLIEAKDKICVGVSGGKDSMALIYALNLYKKFSRKDFELFAVTLDLGFDNFSPEPIKTYLKTLGVDLIVYEAKDVYKILKIQMKDKAHLPCSICSRMKKAAINKAAKELGCNKVAFAHHADDALETLLMNSIYGARLATFSPKMYLTKADITFIRPLILTREDDIRKLVKEENIQIISSACPADKFTMREDAKTMLNALYKKYPTSKENFLSMLTNYDTFDIWTNHLVYQIENSELTIKPVTTPELGKIALYLRVKVFTEEQNIPLDHEFDDLNGEYHEYVCFLKEKAIGYIRYIMKDDGIKIERFCVLKEYRNKGYGHAFFSFIEKHIRDRYNPCHVYLHGQEKSLSFYLKEGYTKENAPFVEEGINHYLLSKDLR